MAQRLVVIAGGPNSGKMPLARRLMAEDPALVLIHRDYIRDALVAKVSEWQITLVMIAMAEELLSQGSSVIVCAWNLAQSDYTRHELLARRFDIEMEWLDTRQPAVAAMIPPLEETK